MKEALKAFALIHVEMEPGDALFFHCNLLHRSDQNHSNQRRWAMITSFNQRLNNPGNNCILLGFDILLHLIFHMSSTYFTFAEKLKLNLQILSALPFSKKKLTELVYRVMLR